MTIPVQNTEVTNTFDFWRNRTNEMATYFTSCVITTDANPNTTPAFGNASIIGTFSANTFIANNIQISNTSGNFIMLPKISNSYTTDVLTVNAAIDNFTKTDHLSAEYILHVKDNNANNFYSSKLLVTHDGDASYFTEYAIIISNSSIGSFATSTNTTHVILNFVPTSTNTTVNFLRLSF